MCVGKHSSGSGSRIHGTQTSYVECVVLGSELLLIKVFNVKLSELTQR